MSYRLLFPLLLEWVVFLRDQLIFRNTHISTASWQTFSFFPESNVLQTEVLANAFLIPKSIFLFYWLACLASASRRPLL